MTTSDDEKAIRALVDTWMRATKSGEAESVLSLMTDDVVFMVPGQEPFGKEAFAAASKGMKGARFEVHSEIREIKVLGDWAYMWTRLSVAMTPPGGAPMKRAGHTLSILKKQNGKWLLARDANMLAPND